MESILKINPEVGLVLELSLSSNFAFSSSFLEFSRVNAPSLAGWLGGWLAGWLTGLGRLKSTPPAD